MRRQKVKGSSVISPPTSYPQPGSALIAGTTNSSMGPDLSIGPYDLGNERIDTGSSFSRQQAPLSYPSTQSQAQVPRFQPWSTPRHRNSSEAFFHINQSNSDLLFQTEGQFSEPAPERGDWLDRLEAMFCPTDAPSPNIEQRAQGGTLHPSWLEPRPIRPTNATGQEKSPPSYTDSFK
jgi:hypothetical protein